MRNLIKSLSEKSEFAIVIILGFGYPIIGSILAFITKSPSMKGFPLSSNRLYVLVIYEILILLVIFVFLKYRGWSLREFNFKISWKLALGGVLLLIIDYMIYFFIYVLSNYLFSSNKQIFVNQIFDAKPLDIYSILAVSIVNPIFEEGLVVGYIVSALKRNTGIAFAITVSVLIRFVYHLYQGPFAVIAVIPMGLLFAYVYHRWGRLFPLILAHGILDFIALSNL